MTDCAGYTTLWSALWGPGSDAPVVWQRQADEAIMGGHLTPREIRVLTDRFGLAEGHVHTLAAVGAELHLSKERVRAIERKALRKLRTVLRALRPWR